jgi:hypothetical protein
MQQAVYRIDKAGRTIPTWHVRGFLRSVAR